MGNVSDAAVEISPWEPLNGLVATISSERLIAGHAGDLAEYGAALRKRMTISCARWAHGVIYVMVAKIDKLHGVDELIARMTEDEPMQCAGVLNPVEQGPFSAGCCAAPSKQSPKDGRAPQRFYATETSVFRISATGEISALEGTRHFRQGPFHRNPYMGRHCSGVVFPARVNAVPDSL